MNTAHFTHLDLNLLRVFSALLDEGSATRAGSRLGLSQSAVSHALARLRVALGDDLFVRGPAGLQPTPRAAEMGEAIRAALAMMETAISASVFDPATAQRVFQVAASAYVSSVLMPAVVRRLLVQAPGVRLRLRTVGPGVAEDLDRGRLDLVVGSFEQVSGRFAHAPLFSETGVWVMRSGHPAARPGLTLADIGALPLLTIAGGDGDADGRAESGSDSASLGLKYTASWGDAYALGARSIRDMDGLVSVPDAYTALIMIGQTDMVALLPRRLAALALQGGGLILIEPDRPAEPVSIGAAVRKSDAEGGPVAWLLGLIQAVAAEI